MQIPTRQMTRRESYGCRTVAGLIDNKARTGPTKPFAILPAKNSFGSPYLTVTFKVLARAVDRASWWLEQTVGPAPASGRTIAWMGPNDLRYLIFQAAAQKTGYTLLMPSPRNSVAFHVHIFQATSCTLLIKDCSLDFQDVKKEAPQIEDIGAPALSFFLDDGIVEHYPFEESKDLFHKPWIIIHSSGSTGMPKCITWTASSFASLDRQRLMAFRNHEESLIDSFKHGVTFVGFPLFHAAGILFLVGLSLFYGHTVMLPPPGQMKALTVIDALDHVKIDTLMVPPSILEEICLIPGALQRLSYVNEVVYAGGNLSSSKGTEIAKIVKVSSQIGSSETAGFPTLASDQDDWNYFRYPTDLKGLEFREVGNELCELVIVRDTETDDYHSTWHTFPDLQEYSTKDLYSRHPTKPGLFKYEGRCDDVLVLSNGEKVVTLPLEGILRSSPHVKDALVIGQGRFEIAALLELTEEASGLPSEQILRDLQPVIDSGNTLMPKFARLSSDNILLIQHSKEMVRTAKGTVVRTRTLDLFKSEIDQLYNGSGSSEAAQYPLLNATDLQRTVASLSTIISQVSEIQNLCKDDDLFTKGFDSLGVMTTARKIKTIISIEKPDVADLIIPSLIYSNSTIESLAKALRSLGSAGSGEITKLENTQRAEAADMLEKYTRYLPNARLADPIAKDTAITVVLTGSTGSLGAYLLDSLLASPKIAHVYALNRSADGVKKQIEANKARNLSIDFQSKVTFFQADIGRANLGLSAKHYELIQNSANLIIHNQWQVDFNLNLKSFEPFVAGVRNLIDLSLGSRLQPYIMFTSTVSGIGSYFEANPAHERVPEAVFEDVNVAMPMGYAISKQIGERMLDFTSKRTGLRTATARIGQVSGPAFKKGGVWNKQEWFPSLAVSSAHLKLLPKEQVCIDWIPVDILADVLVDLCLYDIGSESKGLMEHSAVYNLANSKWIEWEEMIPVMMRYLPADSKVVSTSEWVKALKECAVRYNDLDLAKNPAIKLIDFYEGMVPGSIGGEGQEFGKTLVIENALLKSKTMRDLTCIRPEWLENWLEGWGLTRQT